MITVYGLEKCGICYAAKDKLTRMGKPFEAKDLTATMSPHDGWRTDGSVEVQATYVLHGDHAPIIEIDGAYFNYSGAMRRLKDEQGRERDASGGPGGHPKDTGGDE
jgi:glutaredoxin